MKKPLPHLAALLLTAVGSAWADVKLPALFSDHLVLQTGVSAPVWGWADPGEEVTVAIGGQTQTVKAASDGKWRLQLAALPATSKAQTLTVKGRNTITINDVLVGEVWLASGQSNMEMQVKGGMHGSVDHADEEIAAAKYPAIRMFVHDKRYEIYQLPVPPAEPMADRPGAWLVCSPDTVASFSAMGYFFARDIHQQIGIPIGVIHASVGGTPIEAWTSLAAQEANPALRPVLDDWQKRLANYDPATDQKNYAEAKPAWLKARAAATKAGEPAPKAPTPFKNIGVMAPGGLYNGLIAPLVQYAVRGVIWYQGERNAAGPLTKYYGTQLRTLIADWRKRWGSDLYFAWVQLPGFNTEQKLPTEPNGWGVVVRDEMRRTLEVPHTSMAITIDLGGAKAGHPTNKADFAKRLSTVVLHDVYQQPIQVWSGPLYQQSKRDGNKLVLTFDQTSGLKPKSGELAGFAIAGADRKFVAANAVVVNGSVAVWSDAVREPVAVRYAWAANPKGNLVNEAGFPASPFRTDDW